MVLIEPMRRRTAFLHECVAALRLDRVEVVQTRAEQLTGRRFDVALARAVAPLPRLLTLSLPLLQPGGSLLALKGAAGTAELAASATELAAAGARGEVRHCGRAWLRHPATVVAVTTPPRRP
jgi:16S rRNA (guanine527-N7)-methyltransferase